MGDLGHDSEKAPGALTDRRHHVPPPGLPGEYV